MWALLGSWEELWWGDVFPAKVTNKSTSTSYWPTFCVLSRIQGASLLSWCDRKSFISSRPRTPSIEIQRELGSTLEIDFLLEDQFSH